MSIAQPGIPHYNQCTKEFLLTVLYFFKRKNAKFLLVKK